MEGFLCILAATRNLLQDAAPILQAQIDLQKDFFAKDHRAAMYDDCVILSTVATTTAHH